MKDYQYHIFAPYRVCPLGAHVDHQHGLVTGFAIDKGVDLWFSVNGSSQIDNGELKISKMESCGRHRRRAWRISTE